jgi:hypothetical protein
VRENLQGTIQTKEVTITKPMKTWCCIDNGSVVMKTAFEKSAYAPGEEARVITEVDNSKGGLCIQNTFFSLNQTLSLTAGAHHRSFHFNIRSLDLGGAQPGECFKEDTCKIGSIQLPPGQEGKSKDFRGESAQISDAPLDPKMVLTPSTHGKLVKSDFHLTVSCNVDGCLCCDSPPSITLPIQIYSAARMQVPDPQPPANWKPQQMPTANLTITIVQRADGGQDIHIQQGESQPGMPNTQMPQQSQIPQQSQMPMNNNMGMMNNGMNNQMMNNNMGAPMMNNGMNNQMPPMMNNNQPCYQPGPNKMMEPQPMMMNNNMGAPMMNNGQPGYQPMTQEMNMNPQYMNQPGYNGNFGGPQTMNPQQVQVGQHQQYNPQMNQGY